MYVSLSYEQGMKDAKADFLANLMPKPLRGYSVEYRNGYSDGYHKASGGRKKW